MELLSISCSKPWSCAGYLNWKVVEKSLNSSRSDIILARKSQSLCTGFKARMLNKGEGSRLTGSFRCFHDVSNTSAMSESHSSYVVGGKDDLGNVSEREESTSKVLIPGLPDESNGDYGSPISSCYWEWKPKYTVHYEKAGTENVNSPPVLFLPGFGVGSFHYEKQLKDLGREFRVWALDFLGQGMSLPSEDPAPCSNEKKALEGENSLWGFGKQSEPWAAELVYSIDLWREQVRYFVEEVKSVAALNKASRQWFLSSVIGEPVYVVGNSLGGFVALYFAACNPQLVKGVTLLNATPFWGFLPNPIRSPRLAKIFPWAGTFPMPDGVRKLTEFVWQKISDPRSIGEVLKQVYADHSIKVDKVFSRILEVTEHPAAAASFASIMFAPKGELSFQEALLRCQMSNIPICLMYGKEDPWVRPVWGQMIKKQVPEAPYYVISPAGHCPHDEVPEVVNYLLRGWIENLESQGSESLPLLNVDKSDQHVSKDLEFLREGSKKSVRVHFFGSEFSVWRQIGSYIRSRVTNSGAKFL
ncbi:hypothetical protein Sjap_002300 [Stephania japonica]|uniref:AB hydrolase-1 domain-containing protein n=1 Tax=Stephania japonica TaxID=461633 RepID=A0AAP0KMJ6_9MAGN